MLTARIFPNPTCHIRLLRWAAVLAFNITVIPLLTTSADAATPPAAPKAPSPRPASWTADNGNGTYTNPLFYEEFSDPDVTRVDSDYYLTGTTMHAMPGLPVLHSKDLVNWDLASYCFDKLDLSPAYHLDGGEMYGQGIWAPCIRFHNGTFHIFSNVNNFGTHLFTSASPKGPWKHTTLATRLYDLSVLFDDDAAGGPKIWAVSGVREITLTELKPDLSDVVPNTAHVIIRSNQGMGEGLHFYKAKDRYYIVSALPGAHTDMVVAKADTLAGPWQIDHMVTSESLGTPTQNALRGAARAGMQTFSVAPSDPNNGGGLTIHQGGIVDTPSGEWWSIIMQDHGSVGRLSCLVPITWTNDFPIIGLPGNLRKAPATWVKPNTGFVQEPRPLFERSDNFDSGKLLPVWQWNHIEDDTKWSLTEKPGVLRLHALAAPDFWMAKNTLTQRAIGPESIVTVELDASGMKPGDVAGLALLNQPYAWIGLGKTNDALELRLFDQTTNKSLAEPAKAAHLWLRAACNYDTEKAIFSWSADGKDFTTFATPFTLVYQLKTFQGIRYSLFNYHTAPAGATDAGGFADFDNFTVEEPRANPGVNGIPLGKTITLTNVAFPNAPIAGAPDSRFQVVDQGLGRVALQVGDKFLSVSDPAAPSAALKSGPPAAAETFQWIDLQRGDIMLMSLTNHRYLEIDTTGAATANGTGPTPDHKNAATFKWKIAE